METSTGLHLKSTVKPSYPQGITVIDEFLPAPHVYVATSIWRRYQEGNYSGLRSLTNEFSEELGNLITAKLPQHRLDLKDAAAYFHRSSFNTFYRIHVDEPQCYYGVLYLTPDAPEDAGTRFYKNSSDGVDRFDPKRDGTMEAFRGKYFSPRAGASNEGWIETAAVGNIYNRLMVFDGYMVHGVAATAQVGVQGNRLVMLITLPKS